VPEGFWLTQQMRDAFVAQHIGRVSRAYRKHPAHLSRYGNSGISQELLGHWLGLTQAQISRIETGPPVRNLDTLAHWARVLTIPPVLLWFRLPATRHTASQAPRNRSRPPVRAAASALLTGHADAAAHDHDVEAMRAFRAADLQVGGTHLYANVIRYLHDHVAPRLFGITTADTDTRSMFTAAGALAEMAGWMAHDAGNDTIARQHFDRSLALAQAGGDRQLRAHVLGSMSHLTSHQGDPGAAIMLARQGQSALTAPTVNPALQARLLALEARGHAAQADGGHEETIRLLLRAEQTMQSAPSEPVSIWVSNYDEGSLASDAGRCARQLGDLTQARRQAELVIASRPAHRARSRAFGQLTLAAVLVLQHEPDQACAIAADVLTATRSLSSYLVTAQLVKLRAMLLPYRGSPAVSGFLAGLDEKLDQRVRRCNWLTATGHELPVIGEGS